MHAPQCRNRNAVLRCFYSSRCSVASLHACSNTLPNVLATEALQQSTCLQQHTCLQHCTCSITACTRHALQLHAVCTPPSSCHHMLSPHCICVCGVLLGCRQSGDSAVRAIRVLLRVLSGCCKGAVTVLFICETAVSPQRHLPVAVTAGCSSCCSTCPSCTAWWPSALLPCTPSSPWSGSCCPPFLVSPAAATAHTLLLHLPPTPAFANAYTALSHHGAAEGPTHALRGRRPLINASARAFSCHSIADYCQLPSRA